jgi:hypothetical protein
MTKVALAGVLFALMGCVGSHAAMKEKMSEHGDPEHPLFVGHSDHGEVVVAATHYDAMGGMAVTARELGQKGYSGQGSDPLICDREMETGTHVPKWVCRYQKDVEAEREATRDWIDKPRNCLSNCGGPAVTPH